MCAEDWRGRQAWPTVASAGSGCVEGCPLCLWALSPAGGQQGVAGEGHPTAPGLNPNAEDVDFVLELIKNVKNKINQ